MPTKHRRHAITETPEVKAALDPLRAELGSDRVPLAELIVLGARAKAAQLEREKDGVQARRRLLTDRIRRREPLGDPDAAEEVRRRGWVRQWQTS